MAIDSRNKRSSVLNYSHLAFHAQAPDGDLSTKQDRQHMGWMYEGIDSSVPVTPTGTSNRTKQIGNFYRGGVNRF